MTQPSASLPSAQALPRDCSYWMEQLIEAWNRGEWSQCLSLSQKITTDFPEEGLAWKLMGSLYQQQNDLKASAEAFAQAGKLLKKDAEVFYNLANVYAQLQEHSQAIKFYRQTLKLNPAFSRAYANWAGVLKQLGLLKEAEKLLRRGLNIHQQDARVNFELATILHEASKPLEAIQYYREAVAIEPDNAVIFFNMAVALELLGNVREAIQAFETAIANQPHYIDAYSHLGALYLKQDNFEEAEQWLLAGYAVNPQDLSVLKNLTKLYRVTQRTREYQYYVDQVMHLQDFSAESLNSFATEMFNQHLYSEAESYCLKAMEADPGNPHVHANLALIENARAEFGKACVHFEKALEQIPDSESTLSNYSVSLRMLGRYSEAITCLEKALKINPGLVAAYINLANVYLDMGQIEKAIVLLKKALQIEPTHLMALRNLLFSNSYSNTLTLSESLDYAQRLGAAMMKDVTPYENWHVHAKEQRIRIGLVSGDLRKHPVAYFLHQWLQAFDASQLEVYGYSTDGREDAFSHELKDLCNQWRSLAGLSDAQAATKIREDGIHILLDLSGLSGGSRLPIFAHKPAPVQAAWLGYWATTGLPVMDYIIADPVSIDTQVAAQFTEQVAYLPQSRMCFTAPAIDIAVNALPALATGAVTFGCFQNYSKVNDDVLACWGEILQAVPTAKLFWQTKAFNDAGVREQTLAKLQQFGIEATRCTLRGFASREEYLRNHHHIDVILDTFPFTGGTTTCEALWMGVPTVTMLGETLIARQGASFLHCVGLHDWVAGNRDEYISKAISFVSDLDALAAVRAQLRQQVVASPLMNAELFAQDFEQLLFKLWNEAVQKLEPAQLQANAPVQDAFTGEQPVWVVSATRMSEEVFWRKAALGRSLKRHMQQDKRLVPVVAFENTRGLSQIFNQAIEAAPDHALLILVHDDVWLDENTFVQKVMTGLEQYDVIGVAGNARRQPGQTGWCFVDAKFNFDDKAYLRGAISHGQHAFGQLHHYGEVSGQCQLIDGVFFAAHKQTLLKSNVRFDTQFDFHFYDLDFCRSASQAGLQLGVWPVALTHQSDGAFGTQRWRGMYQQYMQKWEPGVQNTFAALDASIVEVFDLAVEHQQQGQYQAARELYLEILQIHPQHALTLHNLGLIAWEENQPAQAIDFFEKAHVSAPEEWLLLSNYLNALYLSEDAGFDAVLSQALQSGQHTQALQTLLASWGVEVTQQVSPEQTLATEEEALLELFALAQYAEMQQRLELLLPQHPDWLTGWKMLTDVRMVLKQDAREAAQRALALNNDDPQEHCYYGLVLKAQGDLKGAASAFEQAIALNPDYAAAYNNLGIVLKDTGEVDAAIAHFKQALALQPRDASCFSNLLFCMSHAQGIASEELLQAHLAFADLYELPLKADWQPHANTRDVTRPLKVGMVSADFRAHSVAHFLQPLLPGLASHQSLELYAYYNHPVSDQVTAEMREYFAHWQDVSAWSDTALADAIREDGIDILVDLSGHTAGNRLLTFAAKPAPVQVSWLGYLHSTGLSAINYYLTDAVVAPETMLDKQFSETLVKLPVSACFTPHPQAPEVSALPALQNGYVTFGCFNRPNKITPSMVQIWAELLNALPTSRLLLGGMGDAASSEAILNWLQAAGVAAERISLVQRGNILDYLSLYQQVDICLDTLPSSGVTTTAHALWMGVPTLCMHNQTLRGRGAMALMHHAGLQNWVVASEAEFTEQGVALCHDLESLAALRKGLRAQLSQSVLAKPDALADALAHSFLAMWQRFCNENGCNEKPAQVLSLDPVNPSEKPASSPGVDMLATLPSKLSSTVPDQDLRDQQENSIAAVLAEADTCMQQGSYDQAAYLYREILKVAPNQAEANYQLAFIVTHTVSVQEALPNFESAVTASPWVEQYWVGYIDALMMANELMVARQAIFEGRKYGLTEVNATMLLDEISLVLQHRNAGLIDPQYTLKTDKFVIVAPFYFDKSAGIVVLHELCDEMNKRGYPTAIYLMGPDGLTISHQAQHYGPDLKWYAVSGQEEMQQFINEGVVIYPEVVSGNPVNAPRVVRYVLNSEGFVGGNKMNVSDSDFILSYSSVYHAAPHAILTKICHHAVFNTENTLPVMDRKMDMTYIGKGSTLGECYVMPGTVELTRHWPKNKDELAVLLKNTRYLYTWDFHSQTVTDALLCGVIPVYMNLAPFTSFDELHPAEAAYKLRTFATLEHGQPVLSIPEDCIERQKEVLDDYYDSLQEFDRCIDGVLSQIISHFAR